jgi:type IV secretory pathway TrbL component
MEMVILMSSPQISAEVVMGHKEYANAAYVNLTMQISKKFIAGKAQTGSGRVTAISGNEEAPQ